MSAYYYGPQHAHPTPAVPSASNSHSQGRNRRAPRLSVSQNANRQFRPSRAMKEIADTTAILNYRTRFEATRSFDLEDDLEFCPNLLTDNDVSCAGSVSSRSSSPTNISQLVSIHSASERSSLASTSPDSSPTQQPQNVAPAFHLNSSSPPFVPPAFHSQQSSLKLHQPAATRGRNAIPIVNPATGATMSSPPPSVSPAKMHQGMGRQW